MSVLVNTAAVLLCVLTHTTPQGRISRRVTVPLPDEAGRAAILGVHLRGVTLDEESTGGGDKTQVARQLAALTAGFSGTYVCMCDGCVCVVEGGGALCVGALGQVSGCGASDRTVHVCQILFVALDCQHCCCSIAAGAELSNIVNEALLLTARRGSEAVGLAELLEGLQRTR